MTTKIERLTEELKTHLKVAQDIATAAEKDNDRDLTDAERAQVTEAFEKAKTAKKALTDAKADDQTKAAIRELGDGIGLAENGETSQERGEKAAGSGLIVPDGRKSIGEHFVESQAYKALLASAPNGQFGEKMRVQSQPVGYKALITGADDTSAGGLIPSDRRGLLNDLGEFQRPLALRNLVTPGTTTSDQVEYARIASTTNAAATVPEATTTAEIGSGTPAVTAADAGLKPESGLTTVRVTTPVRTIAHWLPATKRALSDAAQVRTLVDNFLEYGLEEELDDQMISGDGTGENFTGLANVSGVQTQAADAGGLLHTTRKAKTKVRLIGRAVANGYVFNPNDLERIDLLQDNEARFYFGGPSGVGTAGALWGLPVVESEAVPAGTAYCGDWRKAILWDREQASVTVTDSHADFFVRNLVAILAEMRAAFGVIQPSAFVRITL